MGAAVLDTADVHTDLKTAGGFNGIQPTAAFSTDLHTKKNTARGFHGIKLTADCSLPVGPVYANSLAL